MTTQSKRAAGAEAQRRWRSKLSTAQKAELRWKYNLSSVYGITEEQYEAMLTVQGGRCAICRSLPTWNWPRDGRSQPRLCIDHDHQTGKVRGLLCHACNVGIGNLGDDASRVRAALTYLLGKVE